MLAKPFNLCFLFGNKLSNYEMVKVFRKLLKLSMSLEARGDENEPHERDRFLFFTQKAFYPIYFSRFIKSYINRIRHRNVDYVYTTIKYSVSNTNLKNHKTISVGSRMK